MDLLEANQTLLGGIGAGLPGGRRTGPSHELGNLQVLLALRRLAGLENTYDIHRPCNITVIGFPPKAVARRDDDFADDKPCADH